MNSLPRKIALQIKFKYYFNRIFQKATYTYSSTNFKKLYCSVLVLAIKNRMQGQKMSTLNCTTSHFH